MLIDAQGGTSPNIAAGDTSPLEALAMRALRRFGEMSPSSMEGDALLSFIDYGNEVIDDILGHPYADAGLVIGYYTHPSEARAIPDHIVIAGLLARHADQLKSKAAGKFMADYYAKMNQVMARVKFGVGAEYRLQAVDYPDKA